jgi:hypothetical protein
MDRVAQVARQHGLVVIAGAGISMLPPSSLPSWWDFNKAVLEALADRLSRHTNRQWTAKRLSNLLERRRTTQSFTPDFMAQLMEEEVGADYFRVLQALDAEQWNANHAAFAALAAAGVLKAVITTNFDRLMERALTAQGVAHRVFAKPEEFEQLHAALADSTAPLPVIKAHGTVDQPDSMVDTLAQRVAGRPRALEDAIVSVLERHACLTLGFSGADLAYDSDYLGLRRAAEQAPDLTVLVRAGTAPLDAMRSLVSAYGDRGRMTEGELPGAIERVCELLDVTPPAIAAATPVQRWTEVLEQRTRAWIDGLGTMPAINMFVSLVDTNADDPGMLDFLLYFRRYYRTEEDTVDPWLGTRSYWRYEYNFGKRLLERGRLTRKFHELDAGRHLLESSIIAFQPYEDALNFLNNASERGGLLEAKSALTEYVLLMDGPQRAMAHATEVIKAVIDAKNGRVAAEAALAAARSGELALEYDFASQWIGAANEEARGVGDEPRRAAAAVATARVAACIKRYDVAETALTQAAGVAERLGLSVLRADVNGARGMLLSLQDRDADAVAPLELACAFYRRTERQPKLFIALLDLLRASHYSRQRDTAQRAYEELQSLESRYPGLVGLLILAECELMIFDGDLDQAKNALGTLRTVATRDPDYPWKRGLDRADRMEQVIAERQAQ